MSAIEEVLAYLKKNPTYFLATVDEEGNPQVRPFGTATLFDGKLYIETGRSKSVFKQMAAHPRVAMCAMDAEGGWLRIEADAVEDDRLQARQASLDDYPELKDMYAADDGNCTVLALTNATATFYSFASEPRAVTF